MKINFLLSPVEMYLCHIENVTGGGIVTLWPKSIEQKSRWLHLIHQITDEQTQTSGILASKHSVHSRTSRAEYDKYEFKTEWMSRGLYSYSLMLGVKLFEEEIFSNSICYIAHMCYMETSQCEISVKMKLYISLWTIDTLTQMFTFTLQTWVMCDISLMCRCSFDDDTRLISVQSLVQWLFLKLNFSCLNYWNDFLKIWTVIEVPSSKTYSN